MLNEQSFWSRVDKTESCWLWRGATSGGRPLQVINGRSKQSRRIAYKLLCGPIPPRTQLRPKCGNRLCVRPEHMALIQAAAPEPALARTTRPDDGATPA